MLLGVMSSTPVYIDFWQRLIKHSPTKVFLIVDGHPVHRGAAVRDFVARHSGRLRLVILPGYCPELNPNELLNQDVKINALRKEPLDQQNRAHQHCARASPPSAEATTGRSQTGPRETCSLRRSLASAQPLGWVG